MFEFLSKYQESGEFIFTVNDNLKSVCNDPVDKSGVYIVSTIINNNKKVIYIGRSGEKVGNVIKHRKNGLMGRLAIDGKQFNEPRKKAWPKQMIIEFFDTLFIQWWNTENDCPIETEKLLLGEFRKKYNHLPLWNNKN